MARKVKRKAKPRTKTTKRKVKARPKKRKAATKKRKTTKKKKTTKRKKTSKRKPSAAFMKPMTPSSSLAEIIGSKAIPRTQVVKKVWAYIKRNKLQDKKQRTMINADAKMKPIFRGKKKVTMFEMTKYINKHLH